jgi:hypothetical protein
VNKNAVVYPRGFLGFNIGLPVEKRGANTAKLLESVRFNKEIDETRLVISNKKIEELYLAMQTAQASTKSFDFRERILLVALHAFGTQSFLDWLILQEKSPYLSDTHRRFINDTLEFISTGKRAMSVVTWKSFIRVRELNGGDSTPELKTRKFFCINGPVDTASQRYSLKTVLTSWVGQPGGFEDLLFTLHILFGDSEGVYS